MKISIELTKIEVAAIKKYLTELDGVPADKAAIEYFIKNIVSTTLYSPSESVSAFIDHEEKRQIQA